jgi:hypothetical protein
MSLVSLPAASTLDGFPRRWQDACRSALLRYCDLPENRRRGQAMKMTRLRNLIMEDFNTLGGEGLIKNETLGREHLEHWVTVSSWIAACAIMLARWKSVAYAQRPGE